MYVCWSVKGGQGTTVVAAGLGLVCSASEPVILVDLGGDLASVLGVAEPPPASLFDPVPLGGDALRQLMAEVSPVAPGIGLLTAGTVSQGVDDVGAVADVICDLPGAVVVDAGRVRVDDSSASGRLAAELASRAERSLLVTRACYLALRRVAVCPVRPTEVVLLEEIGRSLHRLDVEDVADAPVLAEVPVEAAVARAVDAGLLAGRPPRSLTRALGVAAA